MPFVLSSRYKPTRHFERFRPEWRWVRQHSVAAWMFWERGYWVIYNIATARRNDWGLINGTKGWAESKYGPCFVGNGSSYIDTSARFGNVGLFAASTERWTLAVRASFANNVQSFIVGRGSSTPSNRTFAFQHNRPGGSTITPSLRIRGGTALNTNWGLDDGFMHTYWVTWDGTTCLVYYDDAQGGLSCNVGTAVEEASEHILLGAVTTLAPFGMFSGLFDFAALLDVPLSPGQIRYWNKDLYAPWRPYMEDVGKSFAIQTIRPASDIAAGGWTNELGGTTNLFASVDEPTPDDADYIQSPVNPSAAAVELKLGTAQTPSYAGGGTLHLRHRRA